jgi:hypothetical protein
LEKIVKAESQADYKEMVPENVRQINEDKVWLNVHPLFYGPGCDLVAAKNI